MSRQSQPGPRHAVPRRPRWLACLAYLWVSPTTSLGLLVALFSPSRRVVEGVLEVDGGLARFILERCIPLAGGATAMTLGHVVIARSRAAHDLTRAHERVHVRQCERWGPLFVPAYFLASACAWWTGHDPYRGNPFEREAFEQAP